MSSVRLGVFGTGALVAAVSVVGAVVFAGTGAEVVASVAAAGRVVGAVVFAGTGADVVASVAVVVGAVVFAGTGADVVALDAATGASFVCCRGRFDGGFEGVSGAEEPSLFDESCSQRRLVVGAVGDERDNRVWCRGV